MKRPLNLTRGFVFYVKENDSNVKGNIINLCNKLTGTLFLDFENESCQFYKGRLKLSNDPKVENIDENNLVLTGSVLNYTKWYNYT